MFEVPKGPDRRVGELIGRVEKMVSERCHLDLAANGDDPEYKVFPKQLAIRTLNLACEVWRKELTSLLNEYCT